MNRTTFEKLLGAAVRGDPTALFDLGQMLLTGRYFKEFIVPSSPPLAHRLLQTASTHGSSDAARVLAQIDEQQENEQSSRPRIPKNLDLSSPLIKPLRGVLAQAIEQQKKKQPASSRRHRVRESIEPFDAKELREAIPGIKQMTLSQKPNDSDFLVLLGRVVYLIVALLVVLGVAGLLWFGINQLGF